MLLPEMKKVAKDIGLKNYSKMKKNDLEKKLKKCGGLKTDFKIVCTNCNGQWEYPLHDFYLKEAHLEFYKAVEESDLARYYNIVELIDNDENIHDKLICP